MLEFSLLCVVPLLSALRAPESFTLGAAREPACTGQNICLDILPVITVTQPGVRSSNTIRTRWDFADIL